MYSPFLHKKKTDGTLCSARHPGPSMPFPYSKQSRNYDASSNFIDCNPQKARRKKVPSAEGLRISAQPKSRGRQPAYTHQTVFIQQQSS